MSIVGDFRTALVMHGAFRIVGPTKTIFVGMHCKKERVSWVLKEVNILTRQFCVFISVLQQQQLAGFSPNRCMEEEVYVVSCIRSSTLCCLVLACGSKQIC
jgi:hypothetical protein